MEELKNLRKIIDSIDEQILDLIKSRIEVVAEIGEIKKQNDREVVDGREEEVYNRLVMYAQRKGIKTEIVKKIWKILIDLSYEIEAGSVSHHSSVGEGGKNGKS